MMSPTGAVQRPGDHWLICSPTAMHVAYNFLCCRALSCSNDATRCCHVCPCLLRLLKELPAAEQVLPGGRLLASADEAGGVAVHDLRLLGAADGGRALLWHARPGSGGITSLAAGLRPHSGAPFLVRRGPVASVPSSELAAAHAVTDSAPIGITVAAWVCEHLLCPMSMEGLCIGCKCLVMVCRFTSGSTSVNGRVYCRRMTFALGLPRCRAAARARSTCGPPTTALWCRRWTSRACTARAAAVRPPPHVVPRCAPFGGVHGLQSYMRYIVKHSIVGKHAWTRRAVAKSCACMDVIVLMFLVSYLRACTSAAMGWVAGAGLLLRNAHALWWWQMHFKLCLDRAADSALCAGVQSRACLGRR